MKQRIKPNITEEELDSFLKENYGYGIWEFESYLYYYGARGYNTFVGRFITPK